MRITDCPEIDVLLDFITICTILLQKHEETFSVLEGNSSRVQGRRIQKTLKFTFQMLFPGEI